MNVAQAKRSSPSPPTSTARQAGVDVARAIALIGVVVMNYHGYLILRGGTEGESFINRTFNPFTGPLSTRFAATFVLVAGMGVTLMTNRSRLSGDRSAITAHRWVLVRRGLLLYAFGYAFDWIWNGTILFYYGAMFVIAAGLFTLRIRWLVAAGAAAAIAAAALRWWRFEREQDGHRVDWLFGGASRSPRSLLFETFVNGTHPLLPWLAFLCAGIVVGRLLPLALHWRMLIVFNGILITVASHLLKDVVGTTPLRAELMSTVSFQRSINYTIGTLASSLAAVCLIISIADATRGSRITGALAIAGRTTLTLYVLHALVFNAVVELGWIKPAGLDTALAFALAFWIVAIVAADAWARRFGMGPLERAYRHFGG